MVGGLANLSVLISMKDKLAGPYRSVYAKLDSLKKPVREFHMANVKAFRAIEDQVPGLSSLIGMIKNPYVLATAAVVGLGAATVKATRMAMDYETGMAKINATAQLTGPQLKNLRGELMEIGRDSGGNFAKVPQSFEKILSQVGDVNTSMDILKASVAGTKAGFTDLDVVSAALAQTVSVTGAGAQDVLDTFMAAKRVGAGEFQDFANYLPTLVAAGKNLGMQYKDVAGVFAFMTGKGQDAASATMLMQNAFTALGKSEIQKGLKNAGVSVFDKKGTMRDIGDIMADLSARMGSMSDEGKSNFLESIGLRDVQAKNAISLLVSDTQKLRSSLDATNNAFGETQKAIDNTVSPSRTWKEITDEVSFVMTSIGYAVLPIVNRALVFIRDGIKGVVNWVRNLWNSSELVRDVLRGIGTVIKTAVTLPFKIAVGVFRSLRDAVFSVYHALGGSGNPFANLWRWINKTYLIFKDVFSQIATIGRLAGQIISDAFHGRFKSAAAKTSELINAARNFSFSAAAKRAEQKMAAQEKSEKNLLGESTGKEAADAAGADPGGEKSPGAESLENVVSGGAQSKSITINIRSLNEGGINISSQTLKEGTTDIEKALTEMLLRVVRNVETAY